MQILGDKLVPGVREVLTEIFKSCLQSEQMLSLTPVKPTKVAEIYLSKEQINAQTPGNLLHTFFTNVRPPKKVLEDQLTQVSIWHFHRHIELCSNLQVFLQRAMKSDAPRQLLEIPTIPVF